MKKLDKDFNNAEGIINMNDSDQFKSDSKVYSLFSFEKAMDGLEDCYYPIDFRQECQLLPGQKLSNKYFVVVIIKKILEILKDKNLGIVFYKGYYYFFNREYWKKISIEELKGFLSYSAFRFGIKEVTANYYVFKDHLLSQFNSTCILKIHVNKNASLVNFNNGTLEITQKGERIFREFQSSDFLTYQLPFSYNTDRSCPLFKEFLDYVVPDKSDQNILAEFIAYAFLPNSFLKLEKAALLIGSGRNGKSTFGHIVQKLFGDENVSSYSLNSLCQENGYYRSMLQNKLINFASEISGHMNTTIAKALISGEEIEVRRPYHDPEIMSDYAKLMFASNNLPESVENNLAFYRRFLIIGFDITIPEDQINPQLAQIICNTELSGVFNWVLEGMERLIENKKFTYSEKSEKLLNDFRLQSDNILLFLDELQYIPDIKNEIRLNEMYKVYRNFCHENGYRSESNKKFANRLRAIGYTLFRKNYGVIVNANQNLIN